MLGQLFDFIGYRDVDENLKEAEQYDKDHINILHRLTCLVHVVADQWRKCQSTENPHLTEHDLYVKKRCQTKAGCRKNTHYIIFVIVDSNIVKYERCQEWTDQPVYVIEFPNQQGEYKKDDRDRPIHY